MRAVLALFLAIWASVAVAQPYGPTPATLPSSGGTLTGAITAPSYNATGAGGYQQSGASIFTTLPVSGFTANGWLLAGTNAGANIANVPIGVHVVGFWAGGSGFQTSEGLGGGTGMTVAASENTWNGYAAGTQCTVCNWITATGHNAAGHEVDGYQSDYYGTDSGKYSLHNKRSDFFGVSSGKFLWNSLNADAFGMLVLSGQSIAPAISGALNNGSGLIRLTVSSTAGITTNDALFIGGVGGVTAANTNGTPYYVNVIDGTHLDLQGSTFSGVYTSGGTILDLPAGLANVAVSAAANNGSGLIRLTVNNTNNLFTGLTAHVSGVTGTTEANGNWTITVLDSPCVSSCRVDLQGSTFTNAYVSGGRLTVLAGAMDVAGFGYKALGSSLITGGVNSIVALGPSAAAGLIGGANILVAGANTGSGTLGSTASNYNVILLGVDGTTDVATGTVQNAVGAGGNLKLMDSSVQLGYRAGYISNIGTTGTRDVLVGFSNGFSMINPYQTTSLGSQVGSSVCQSPASVLLLGTDSNTDCSSANEANAIHIGSGGADIIKVTGTGTPSTSITAIAGSLTVKGVAVSAPLSATSASIGGGALLAGACATAATTVTGATVGMVALATPNTYPGTGNIWKAYVSGVNTVTTEICAIVAATPTASTYNIRVIQ